jgi:hypothetical protein
MATKKATQPGGAAKKAAAAKPKETPTPTAPPAENKHLDPQTPPAENKPVKSAAAKAERAPEKADRVTAWNNKHSVPAPVRVSRGDESLETTTRSLAFQREGVDMVFVEGIAEAVPLAQVKALGAGKPS